MNEIAVVENDLAFDNHETAAILELDAVEQTVGGVFETQVVVPIVFSLDFDIVVMMLAAERTLNGDGDLVVDQNDVFVISKDQSVVFRNGEVVVDAEVPPSTNSTQPSLSSARLAIV